MKKVFSCLLAFAVLFSICALSAINSQAETLINKRGLVLSSPYNDEGVMSSITTNGMKAMFERNGISTSIYVNNQRTNTAFLNAISTSLSNAGPNDISYIYIQAHGHPIGLFASGDGDVLLPYSQLKSTLDGIQGKKVLLIESCFSGSAITDANQNASQQIVNNLFGITSDSVNSGEFIDSDYIVFCSSEADQPSAEYVGGWGLAPLAWAYGGGYDAETQSSTNRLSDTNNDGIVTVQEYFDYCSVKLRQFHDEDFEQDMCYYSASDYASIFFDNYRLGDVNMDGVINLLDARLINAYLSGDASLTSEQLKLADVDGNGQVQLADSRIIISMIADGANSSGEVTA